jgi:hypothetical protein
LFNGFLFQDSKGYAQNVCDEARAMALAPNWGGRSLHICDHRFDDGRVVVRVDKHRYTAGSRKKVSQQSEPL